MPIKVLFVSDPYREFSLPIIFTVNNNCYSLYLHDLLIYEVDGQVLGYGFAQGIGYGLSNYSWWVAHAPCPLNGGAVTFVAGDHHHLTHSLTHSLNHLKQPTTQSYQINSTLIHTLILPLSTRTTWVVPISSFLYSTSSDSPA